MIDPYNDGFPDFAGGGEPRADHIRFSVKPGEGFDRLQEADEHLCYVAGMPRRGDGFRHSWYMPGPTMPTAEPAALVCKHCGCYVRRAE